MLNTLFWNTPPNKSKYPTTWRLGLATTSYHKNEHDILDRLVWTKLKDDIETYYFQCLTWYRIQGRVLKGSIIYSCVRRILTYHLVLPCEAKNQKREKNTHQKKFSTLYTFWILGGNIAKVNKKKSLGKNFFHVAISQLQTWIGLSVLQMNKPKRWINPQKRNMLTLCSWSEKQHARECRTVYDIQGKNERKNPLYFQGNWSKYWKYSERNKASCCVLDLETDRSTFNLTRSFC